MAPTENLYVADTGKGDPVVWVHAFPLHGSMWRDQVAGIHGRRHLVPDLPGFGRTPPAPGVLTMEGAADALVRVLDQRRIERAVFAGCSMGGYILFTLYKKHPGRVKGLVLSDTRAEADSPEAKANREAFAKKVMAEGTKAAEEALLGKLLARAEGEPAERVRRMIAEATPEGIAAAARGMAAREDSSGLLARIAVPTLVLVGEKDSLTPPDVAEKMASAIRGALKFVIPGAGHLPAIEAPDRTTAEIRRFLESI